MSFDEKCHALGSIFLLEVGIDDAERRDELAQEIQDVIESYVELQCVKPPLHIFITHQPKSAAAAEDVTAPLKHFMSHFEPKR